MRSLFYWQQWWYTHPKSSFKVYKAFQDFIINTWKGWKSMQTIKEISERLEVSPATIYNHINKLSKELAGHTVKKKGVTYLDDEALKQISLSMGVIQAPVIQENVSMENVITEISKALAAEVKGDYKELQKQLKKISKTINTDIKNNYQELQEQIQEVREQNNKLVELLEKQNRSLPEKIKEIFKSK